MQRRKQLLRVAAALMLIGTGIGRFEPLVGLLRDGAVHHEGPVAAAQHATIQSGEHGHEHDSEPGPQEHGPQHQHGTAVDHCTHVHGLAVIGDCPNLLLVIAREHPVQAELPLGTDPHSTRPFHPPKA